MPAWILIGVYDSKLAWFKESGRKLRQIYIHSWPALLVAFNNGVRFALELIVPARCR